jgi:hypothetical protein
MRVIAFIENEDVIKKILKHLGLWDIKRKPSPRANAPPIDVFPAYDQTPVPTADDYLADPDYPVEAYFYEVAPSRQRRRSSQERKLTGLPGRNLAKTGFLCPNLRAFQHVCQKLLLT